MVKKDNLKPKSLPKRSYDNKKVEIKKRSVPTMQNPPKPPSKKK
ncbi:MAG: hypothetical protein N4A32_08240 [Marinifilaceae bacterium]|jgi:hypothetical protein|nr:hypothetical protein [Marinifilaceae bacterium]